MKELPTFVFISTTTIICRMKSCEFVVVCLFYNTKNTKKVRWFLGALTSLLLLTTSFSFTKINQQKQEKLVQGKSQ